MGGIKFKRADGLCTVYALRCGYLNTAEHAGDKQAITMGHEGAVYFVKSRAHLAPRGGTLWATFSDDAQGYRDALRLFRSLRASLPWIGKPIGYREENPKLDFFNRHGVYCSSSNWYRCRAHAWANVPVNTHDKTPEWSRIEVSR